MIFGLSTREKILFARNMAIMSRSGMKVPDILNSLQRQATSSIMKKIVTYLIKEVKNGSSLYNALTKYEKSFGTFFINVIKVGEVSGSLAQNLEYLADSLEKKHDLEGKAKGALIYPIIILVAILGMASVMIFFIFPKILPVFESLKVELPWTTKLFIAISNALINYGVFILIALVFFAIGTWFLFKVYRIKYIWTTVLLHIPILSKMIRDFNIVQFSRTMSLLLRSGTRIVEAIEITAHTVNNLVYRKHLNAMAREIRGGETLAQQLIKNTHLFPTTFAEMISVGEKTGKLRETQEFIADFYDRELEQSTKSATSLLEPLLLLCMGLVVSFVAISIITPIYSISQNI